MLNITGGGPRVVAPPWERERLEGSRTTYVSDEDYVEPESGPLELYLSAFPTRAVRWNRTRQMFEITDALAPGWRDLVCELDAPPDPAGDGTPRSPEEVAAMIESGSYDVRQVFRHFDYAFVNQRIHESFEYRHDGSAKYTDRVLERNRSRTRRRHRAIAANTAAGLNEIRRYLPVLAGEGTKIPLLPGGFVTQGSVDVTNDP